MFSASEHKRSPFSSDKSFQNIHPFSTNDDSQITPINSYKNDSTYESLHVKSKNLEFVEFQRKLFNQLGYFGTTTTRIIRLDSYAGLNYSLNSNTVFALLIYTILLINAIIKGIFLAFVITEYFGPVEFLDKIASLDFILCICLVGIGASMLLF